MSLLTNYDNEQLAKITIEYAPNGRVFKQKRNDESNLFLFFKAFSAEQRRYIEKINDLYDGLFPKDSVSLLEYYEKDLGIPDSCFPATGTIEERQRDVIVKKYMMNGNRLEDFKAIAAMYDTEIEIQSGNSTTLFPISFPWTFGADKGVMFITFLNTPESLSSFPWTFPLSFSAGNENTQLACIFDRIKKSTTKIIYRENVV